MRKLFASLVLAFAALGAAAQTLPPFDQVEAFNPVKRKSSKKMFDFYVLDYIGYGFNGLLNADPAYADHTTFWRNDEFYFNTIGVAFRPGEHHSFTLGLDVDWDSYRPDKSHVWIPSEGAVRIGTLEDVDMRSVRSDYLRVFSLEVPLDYGLKLGPCSLHIGAAAQFNLTGRTRFIGTSLDGSEVRNLKDGPLRANDIGIRPLSWNAHAQLTFYSIGFYAKYAPMPVLAGNAGPQFGTWTVGLIIR